MSVEITRDGLIIEGADGNEVFVGHGNPLPVTSTAHTSEDLEGLGKVTVGTTAVELVFSGITESITIISHPDNTGLIYVGKSNVLSNGSNAGYVLDISQPITFDYNDASNAIYVVSDTASQTVIAGATL